MSLKAICNSILSIFLFKKTAFLGLALRKLEYMIYYHTSVGKNKVRKRTKNTSLTGLVGYGNVVVVTVPFRA